MTYNIEIQGLNIEVTDAIKDYLYKKIERAVIHSGGLIHAIKANFSCENKLGNKKDIVEIIVFLDQGRTVRQETASEDMYASIDLASASVERQLRRIKEKIVTVRRHKDRDVA